MNSTNQDNLRKTVKIIRATEGITYRTIAEDLLQMNYNSFINWLNGHCKLGYNRSKILKDYTDCFKE